MMGLSNKVYLWVFIGWKWCSSFQGNMFEHFGIDGVVLGMKDGFCVQLTYET